MSLFQQLTGVEVAKELMLQGIKDDNIVIKYDPDVDGIFAGFVIEQYLRKVHNYIPRVSINSGRGHGVLDLMCLSSSKKTYNQQEPNTEPFPDNATIINVDSGISSDKLKELVNMGYNVVSLDHHEVEHAPNEDINTQLKYAYNGHYGLVINNQYTFEDHKYQFQSGTGIVLTYLQNIDPSFVTKELIAINAITLLSDSRDINNDIARSFLEVLYSVKESDAPWIYKIASTIGFNQYTLGENVLDRTFIDYTFSPYINAAMRLELGYETIKFVNHLDIKLGNVKKAQQDVMEQLQGRAMIQEYQDLMIIRVPSYNQDWYNVSNFIGLLANKYLYKGKNVVIFCTVLNKHGKQDFERGSFRGLYSGINYRELFNENGITALGHFGAFGIKNIVLDNDFWVRLDKKIGILQLNKPSKSVVGIKNLKTELTRIMDIAYENMFKTSETRVYIKYKGMHMELNRSTPKITIYAIDDLIITCFDKELDIRAKTTYLEPVLDKGNLKLYAKTLSS